MMILSFTLNLQLFDSNLFNTLFVEVYFVRLNFFLLTSSCILIVVLFINVYLKWFIHLIKLKFVFSLTNIDYLTEYFVRFFICVYVEHVILL